jgi:hypothetical protein
MNHPVYLVRKFSLIIWSRQPNRIFPSSRSVFCGGPNFRLGQSLSIIGLTNFNGHLLKLRKLSRSIIEKIVLKFSSSLCTHWRDSFNIVPDTWVLQDFFFGPTEFRTCLLNCTNLADVHNITRGLLSLRKPVGSGLNRVQEIHVAWDGADYYSELPYLVFLNGRCKKTAPLLYQSTRFKFRFCGKTRNYVDHKPKCFCCKTSIFFSLLIILGRTSTHLSIRWWTWNSSEIKKKTSFHSVLSNTTFNFRDQSRPIL